MTDQPPQESGKAGPKSTGRKQKQTAILGMNPQTFAITVGGVAIIAIVLIGLLLIGRMGDNGGVIAGLGGGGATEFGREYDIVLGDMDAPVEIIEYASLTCPHCAIYHIHVFPKIKETYIDTGLVRYTLREFPTSPSAISTMAFMLARCGGEGRFYPLVDALFRAQNRLVNVSTQQESYQNMAQIARQTGFTEQQFTQCLSDQAAFDRIRSVQEEAVEKFNVTSTPSFVINGELYPNPALWENFVTIIDSKLPEELRPDHSQGAEEE
jgi:protein-disulfide isomerase